MLCIDGKSFDPYLDRSLSPELSVESEWSRLRCRDRLLRFSAPLSELELRFPIIGGQNERNIVLYTRCTVRLKRFLSKKHRLYTTLSVQGQSNYLCISRTWNKPVRYLLFGSFSTRFVFYTTQCCCCAHLPQVKWLLHYIIFTIIGLGLILTLVTGIILTRRIKLGPFFVLILK